MEELDLAFTRAKTIAAEALADVGKIKTEADAKLKIITRLLTECLGYSFSDIAAESAHESGFSDYIVSIDGKGALLVEAKRRGEIEIRTSEKAKVRHLKINGPSLAKADAGINQAASYSMPNGLPVSVLTDGMSWIVFKTFVSGENFKSKEAIVFPSMEAIINDFSIFDPAP